VAAVAAPVLLVLLVGGLRKLQKWATQQAKIGRITKIKKNGK